MKLNTHDHTPKPKSSLFIKALFCVILILLYGIFGLLSFACFYYARSVIGGILVILIPILLTTAIFIHIKDIEKAYIEIQENDILIVDYYWGIKKEKHISFLDITSAKIYVGYSSKIKGQRLNFTGIRYIVFFKDQQYLFKIIYTPETAKIFSQYLQ